MLAELIGNQDNQLIPVSENELGEVVVSGRKLHEFLEVATQYTKWFGRMVEYGFIEEVDYLLVSQKSLTNNPKNPFTEITDHIIRLDMAKEIAMIQRNDKGKEARQYFLAVEKAWNSPEMVMRRALEIATRNIAKLKFEGLQKDQIIGELKPKADYTDTILKSSGLVTITQIAKDYGMSGQALNAKLHELGVQYKQSGQWLLYGKYHNCGYTHSETVNILHSDGTPDTKLMTKWYQKGRLFLNSLLKSVDIFPIIEQ